MTTHLQGCPGSWAGEENREVREGFLEEVSGTNQGVHVEFQTQARSLSPH